MEAPAAALPRRHGGGQPKRKERQPGADTCQQCGVVGVKVAICGSTGLAYCVGAWDCMKKAGVPSVVNPPKRSKKAVAAAGMTTAASDAIAAATVEASAAAEREELEEELAALNVLLRRKYKIEHRLAELAAMEAAAAAAAAVPAAAVPAAAAASPAGGADNDLPAADVPVEAHAVAEVVVAAATEAGAAAAAVCVSHARGRRPSVDHTVTVHYCGPNGETPDSSASDTPDSRRTRRMGMQNARALRH